MVSCDLEEDIVGIGFDTATDVDDLNFLALFMEFLLNFVMGEDFYFFKRGILVSKSFLSTIMFRTVWANGGWRFR